jgi:hypothetical protein
MWLGIFAILVAFTYALIKFVTTVHMRRLRELRSRLYQDLKRERTRLTSIEGKIQVERSRNGSAKQKLTNARRFKDDLYGRLRLELPSAMNADLRQCVNRHPIPEPAGVKTAHELRLADKVTEALGSLSLLLIEFGDDEDGGGAARTVLEGEVVKALEDREIRYSGPRPLLVGEDEGPSRLTTAFDGPDEAVAVIRGLARTHTQEILTLRATLVAGVAVTEFDQEHVNRLFARTFHGAQQLLEETPASTLIINDQAHEQLADRDAVVEHSAPERLWSLSLAVAAREEPAAAVPAPEAESPGPDAAETETETEAGAGATPDTADGESP